MMAVSIEERVVVAPVVYALSQYLERCNWNHRYWLRLFSIALSATLADDPLKYLTDVYAQTNISYADLTDQVDETYELCDILFNEYAAYLAPLRDQAEEKRVIFNVRDLQYSDRQWVCVLQTIYST